ncbi:MAG: macro domain-containing protein [Pseudomonadota bacterium]
MKERVGDLLLLALDGEFDVIVHGCNCFHTMGGGIARVIAQHFPEALEADKATPAGDREKLGSISFAQVERATGKFTIVNAYTQFDFRGPQPRVSYEAVSQAFDTIAQQFNGARIGYPMIGAGLAGGDWAIISERINTALEGCDHTLVKLPE